MTDNPITKKGPWSEKQRKFVLPKYTRFNTILLPVLQNLTALGLTESDIGAIVGFQGKNADDWLNDLKRHHPEVKDACAIGKTVADSFLVAQMFRSAIGYEYEEVEYKRDKETGEMVEYKRTVRHQPSNAQLAMFLAVNRMPDQFKQKVEVTKKTFNIDGKIEVSADQIERLAGALINEAKKVKQVENTVIESKNLETENVLNSNKNI